MGKRFEVLDSFRGLAAIFIILTHMQYINGINNLTFFQNASVFVEFFFILSGFVMTHSYAFKQDLKFKNFLISRIFRLMPLHLTMFGVFFTIESIKLLAYHKGISFTNIPFEGNQAVREILPNILLLQAWLPTFTVTSFNAPSWSISIEFYIYIIFFITLLAKNQNRTLIWFIVSVIAFALLINNYEKANAILRGLSSFFAGSLTYLIYIKLGENSSNFKKYFVILELILIPVIVFLVISDFEDKSVILSLIFCVTVFTFSYEYGYVSKILKYSLFQIIGKLSYSIYLVHYSVLAIFMSILIVVQKLSGVQMTFMVDGLRYIDFGSVYLNNLSVLTTIVVVISISTFTYKYIEQKGQELGRKVLRDKKSSSLKNAQYEGVQ